MARRRTSESRGRALSSSSISRTELKQIQHTALMEYMERKISQRPGSTQHAPPHKPALQMGPLHPKWPPGRSSNPGESRKTPSNGASCQVSSEEAAPDVFPPSSPVPPPNAGGGCGVVPAKPSLHPAASDRSCSPECVSVQSVPLSGAAAQGQEVEHPSMQVSGVGMVGCSLLLQREQLDWSGETCFSSGGRDQCLASGGEGEEVGVKARLLNP